MVEKLLSYAGVRRSEIVRDNIVFYNNHKHSNQDIYENIEQIELAIRQKKQVSFYYFDLDEKRNRVYRKEKKRYITDPVALVFSEDNYYLVAYSQKYQNAVNYRVDRMDTVEVEEEPICEDALIKKRKTETYTEQVFKMYNGEAETVTLEFAPELLGAVYDKFGEDLEIRHCDGGWLKIKITVQISPPFFGWVFHLCGITAPAGGAARFVFMVAALAVFVVAASLYMTADLGTAPYDAMSFVLAATLPHLPFRAVRMAWDAAWVVLTLVLGGSVGPVTIGIMLLMGPAVDLVGGWAKRTLYRG